MGMKFLVQATAHSNNYRISWQSSNILKDLISDKFLFYLPVNDKLVWEILINQHNPKITDLFKDKNVIEELRKFGKLNIFKYLFIL